LNVLRGEVNFGPSVSGSKGALEPSDVIFLTLPMLIPHASEVFCYACRKQFATSGFDESLDNFLKYEYTLKTIFLA
jgi:hypothetical protein